MAQKSNFIVRGGLDMSAITTGLNKTQKQLKSFQSQTSRSMNALSSGLRMALGYVSVRAIASFIKTTTTLASDLVEVQNVVDVTFGDMGESVNEFAKTSIASYGLSALSAKKYASSLGAMLKSSGATKKQAADMSIGLTKLSADMASFYNLSNDEAYEKIQSGMAGMSRPLRELGINMSVANLNAYALANGYKQTYKQMSAFDQEVLRYNYLMSVSTDAQGDFARTSGSWANQTKILGQQFKVLGGTIGAGFINVLTPFLSTINQVIAKLQIAAEYFRQFTALLFGNGNLSGQGAVIDLGDDASDTSDSLDSLGNAGTAAGNKIKKAFASIDEVATIGDNSKTSTGTTGSIGDIGTGTTTDGDTSLTGNLDTISSKVQAMYDIVKPALEKIIELFDKIEPAIKGVAVAFATYSIITLFSKLAKAIGLISLSPAGVVAIAIGALAAIVFAIIQHRQDLATADLASRFGDIALSIEEVGDMAQKITDTKYSANLDIYITEKSKLDELESNIEADVLALNKLNWKISIGMKLTPEEMTSYGTTVEKFITDSEAYIEQQHYVTKLAINAVVGDEDFNSEITALVDEYFNGSKGEMAQLGKDLRAEMDNALADGVIDSTEQKTIDNLIKEIAEINEQVADSEFKAKLQMITIDGDLTPDSFKDLTAKIQEIITERVGKAEEASYTVLASVNAAYSVKMKNATTPSEKKAIEKEWKETVDEITDNLSQTKSEISFDGTQFSLDSLLDKYSEELGVVSTSVSDKTKSTFTAEINAGITNADPSKGIKALVDGMEWNYLTALDESGMSTATTDGLKEILKGLEPSEAQYKKVYDDALKTGSKIPDGISAQLTSIEKMKALTGDRDAILYLIGQGMAESPEYLQMVLASKTAGSDLDDGIIKGLQSKIPDLQLQGTKLVFTVGKAIKDKSEEYQADNMPRYANKLISGYKSAFDKDGTAVLSTKGWLDKIAKEIKEYKLPTASLSTKLLLNISGIDTSDPLGILSDKKIQKKKNGGFIRMMASGGIPDTGQMFVAREAGPELVGNIGSRSAVANNDQIVEAVSIGVANAVSAVMGGKQNMMVEVPLYLDSEELARGVYKGQQSYSRRMNTVLVGG